MEPQQNTPGATTSKVGTMANLNRVTTFSKYFALVLFIALPIIGLYVGFSMGMAYQQKISAAETSQAVDLLLAELREQERAVEPVTATTDPMIASALAEQLALAADTVTVVSVDPTLWPDGCLGLAQPDEVCTLAEVPGYLVFADIAGTVRAFRTDTLGTTFREDTGIEREAFAVPEPVRAGDVIDIPPPEALE